EFGPIKTLPYGSKLEALDSTDLRWIKVSLPDGTEGYIQKGDVTPEQEILYKNDLVLFSQKFLGLPYTWGGRSSFGFDCSGFVQMLYSQIGINLLRDARQQVLDSRFCTICMDDHEPGDLIFFGRSEQQILHVGMYIGDGQFIHATSKECKPWIRISHLSDFEWSGNHEASYPFRIFRQLFVK
ncbi:MAG: SH3 domain-containing C40 family peptidase, partial [Parachlamydiaceae bacterium]|nr:SH3 domain-containing C40 family peptidase [Parachlamydiaceae bacterium]